MEKTAAQSIATLNDEFRSNVGLPRFDLTVKGLVICTAGITALPPQEQIEIWFDVAQFNAFSEDNDPYGEHDFGALEREAAGRVFWKIDYYADDTMEWASEDPADPTKCFRVLTIMLASEY